jgi:hypothetical protein
MDFINYCNTHRIILAILSPHSTHTLQLLDVVMFKPLSSSYSNELTSYPHQSQELVPIKKRDFFPLFGRAWHTSFRKELIVKSFAATVIWPMDWEVILKRFYNTAASEPEEGPAKASVLATSNWQHMECLVRAAVDNTSTKDTKQLALTLHHLQVENKLLNSEDKDLRNAINTTKKHQKHSKPLDLQQQQQYYGSAVF